MCTDGTYNPKEILGVNFRVLVGNDDMVVLDDKELKKISYIGGYGGHGMQTNFIDDEKRYNECMRICDELAKNFVELKNILKGE